MTADERARVGADVDAKLAEARALLDGIKAREPERLRQEIKIELASERLHKAAVALREARP